MALTESLEARSAMDRSSTRPLPAASTQSYIWMDVDSLGQTPPSVKPQKRPIIHVRSLFQELHAEQRIGHRGCHEWVPFRAMGSPSGRERASSLGRSPPLAAPSTTPALSPSRYWPRAREAAYDISSTSEQISHLPHRWR